jgi:hypothetical protein
MAITTGCQVFLLARSAASHFYPGQTPDRTVFIGAVFAGDLAAMANGAHRIGLLDAACCSAAVQGHAEVVRCLVVARASVEERGPTGQTALIIAAGHGHAEVVRCLIDHCGANIEAKDIDGSTGLLFAAHQGHAEVVRCLVGQYGANVEATSPTGMTAVSFAAWGGHSQPRGMHIKGVSTGSHGPGPNPNRIKRARAGTTPDPNWLRRFRFG